MFLEQPKVYANGERLKWFNKYNSPSHSRGSLEAALAEEASMTAAAAMIDTDFILLLLLLVVRAR